MQTNFCDRGWTDENNMFPQEEEGVVSEKSL
jgi:hypothetical protein